MLLPQPSVGVAIITHHARHLLARCVEPIMASPLRPRIIVVNSSSNDGTVSLARQLGVEVLIVPREEFNHGTTRELVRQKLGTDIAVMLTPDAHAVDAGFLERLLRPLLSGRVAVAYARQLPRLAADPIERFNREFNYPLQSAIRGGQDYARIGNAAHFCSNSAAAWSNAALDEIGGFEAALVSEETIAVARLMRAGHKIAYVADAEIVHSHPASLVGDFRRQFDIGYGRSLNASVLLAHGPDERRGAVYAKALARRLWHADKRLLPRAMANLAARYLGYRLGRTGPKLPRQLASLLSSQDFYWRSTPMPTQRKAWQRAA